MKKKIAVVTGASSGIGKSIATMLLAEALRMELADTDIRITCLEPGLVKTGLHRDWEVPSAVLLDISDTLTPEDIAAAVKDIIGKTAHVRIPRYMILPKGHRI
ncbi:MAG: hypothetical protein JW863_06290 [Chitinispirillaceae bacterium]|nr:hypothetical protein [Chitinispirillaceae bacterium]